MKETLRSFILIINDLSLLVVLGVGLCMHFFSVFYQTALSIHVIFVASSSVFIIYTMDHYLDIKKIGKSAQTSKIMLPEKGERLYYFSKFSTLLVTFATILGIICLYLVLFTFNEALLRGGFLIAGICMIYFLITHFIRFQFIKRMKELAVAATVTLCVAGIPAYLANTVNWDIMLIFFLICFQNLLLFSWFDYESDKKFKQTSLVQLMGKANSLYIFELLSLVNLAITGDAIWSAGLRPELLILILMQVMLIAVRYLHVYLKTNQEYRFAGDMIFCFPVFLWVF